MHGNSCEKKIKTNKKIKFSQKLSDDKEYTNVEGPRNCHVNHKECNNNDNDNNIAERSAWNGQKRNVEVMISN